MASFLAILVTFLMTISTVFAVTAVDSAQTIVSLDSYKCVKNFGYGRVIIRGYFEAYCGAPGGAIDNTFVPSYTNAVNAGFTYIDVYMFPCTGTGPNMYPSDPKRSCCGTPPTQQCLNIKFTCKSPQNQVNELVRLINNTKINGNENIIVRTVWLDVESGYSPGSWPNPDTNRQILQQFRDAWKSTKWNWGIYTNKNEWGKITGDPNWVLDSSLPLWWAYYDGIIDLTKNFVPFGGWNKPTGKQ
ncbi:1583_t:CDS:2, partial [Acaulospora morrowiae]